MFLTGYYLAPNPRFNLWASFEVEPLVRNVFGKRQQRLKNVQLNNTEYDQNIVQSSQRKSGGNCRNGRLGARQTRPREIDFP